MATSKMPDSVSDCDGAHDSDRASWSRNVSLGRFGPLLSRTIRVMRSDDGIKLRPVEASARK